MRALTTRLMALLLAVVLSACSSEAVRPPPAELKPFKAVDKLVERWSRSVGPDTEPLRLRLEPAVGEGVVYAAGADGELSAIDLETGKRLWRVDLDVPLLAGVGIDGRNLYVATRDGELIAVALADQAIAWRAALPSEVVATPVTDGSRVFVYAINGVIMALDSRTGSTLWTWQVAEPSLTLRGTAPLVAEGGRVYAGLSSGRVLALDAQDGSRVWDALVAEPKGRTLLDRLVDVDGGLKVSRGLVTAVAYQGRVVQIEAASGKVVWSDEASGYVAPAVDQDMLVIAEASGTIRAWDNRSGQPLWSQDELAWRDLTAPVFWQGRIVVGDFEGYLHVLDKASGVLRARVRADRSALQVEPRVVGDSLLVQSQGGDLILYQLESSD
ncbi:outer membrane protein assembly factor BamB [Hahella sp. SMD15-11]|uniref:Outer membrane protein assembly factor BamB n=1 Tax=Thermohahella caldifontis TaxID=3142973 RepID=A0AB39UZ16_9GAMM